MVLVPRAQQASCKLLVGCAFTDFLLHRDTRRSLDANACTLTRKHASLSARQLMMQDAAHTGMRANAAMVWPLHPTSKGTRWSAKPHDLCAA